MADFDFQEELKKLPHEPGVYIMHDAEDNVIYVGKAKDLHNRVRSYFRKITGRGPQIDRMVSLIERFEYIITDSELEALVLENNLIKEHSPKYNTMLKDDKTYPYIRVTLGEEYPRVMISRTMKKDRSKYLGPYSNATAVRDTVDLVNRIFGLRTCNKVIPRDIGTGRPCLNHHIGRCLAPCDGRISGEDYRKNVEGALRFLNGEYAETLRNLQAKMEDASERLEFEEAAGYRDLIRSVRAISERQKITSSAGEEKDIIGLAVSGEDAVVQVFFVRDGKLIGREHFYLTNVSENPEVEEGHTEKLLYDFLVRFYSGTPYIPKELFLPEEIPDIPVIEEWLGTRKGSRVRLVIPKIGQKEKLVELAVRNAELILEKDRERIRRDEAKTVGAVRELGELLNIAPPGRMEAFDISNISGFLNVGSMVVFEKGKPKKSDYRKFRMKTVDKPDDYACMREVLERRFLHGLEEKEQLREREMDEEYGSFTKFPDLLLMDGGKGQVNIAKKVLEDLKLNIPVCGMV
ncbi:MAG: excinuclease ABC subunit UvrC, partial [Lachnospiraceae bacterium]|nr:excinuclease ABC subunit UvrC [Lachnospiraceae bacterium]